MCWSDTGSHRESLAARLAPPVDRRCPPAADDCGQPGRRGTGAQPRSLWPGGSTGRLASRYGAGFLFAGLATLVALAVGAFPTRPEVGGQEVEEGLFTYLKLSAIAAGVALGKRERSRRR